MINKPAHKKGLAPLYPPLGWLRGRSGFTLIELLVVIAILAILSVIGFTVFSNVQKGARNSKRISDMKAIVLALEQYYYDPVNNSTYPPSGTWSSECNAWGGVECR